MKKVISTVILTLLIAWTAMAQSRSGRESDYRFAFVLNPQISWLKSDHGAADVNGNLMGYNFGVVMDKFFAKNYAISTGLTINTTGGKLRYNDNNEPIDFTVGGEIVALPPNSTFEYRLKYLEVPFSLKLQTNDFQRASYYGIFGLSGQVNIKTNDGAGKNINDEVRKFNFGYQFGGGMQYSIGGDAYLMFGLTYNQGLSDVTSNKTIDDKANLNRLVFNFGVIF
ncbi:Outer membrane protein beta-barrel domain-containing protein [Saccharicrinis carchari]|uniref:Outer membrane protein beta-barrel domain-containing protein n=1 Tax=Saccharicrinis carchari TaxID=1168039 RepID=A0A521DB42_SACCC|nr:porin family protein [Saccharicrinis carchari]SMO68822.1 Outer membrane protein beta-barrel domain-containing protein [Saccharicrinis carchari]